MTNRSRSIPIRLALLLAAAPLLAARPAMATAYTSNQPGNWSSASVWTPNGVPGAGDTVVVKHAIAVDSNRTIGASLQGCPQGNATFQPNGGSTPTTFLSGTYRAYYTIQQGTTYNAATETSIGFQSELSCGLTNGQNAQVTFPSSPPAGCSYNLYLSNQNGAANTEQLYCSGITGSTVGLVNNQWGNTDSSGNATGGSTAYSGANFPSFVSKCAVAVTTNASASLALNSGVTLTVRGDLQLSGSIAAQGLVLSSGSTLLMDPSLATSRSQAQYFGYCLGSAIACNGANGSRVTVKTNRPNGDEANAVFQAVANGQTGFQTIAYTDFLDLGVNGGTVAANTLGVPYSDSAASTSKPWSCTNSTFTRTNLYTNFSNASWDSNYTLSNCTFSSSIGPTFAGQTQCFWVNFPGNATSGTRTISGCSFDQGVWGNKPNSLQISGNYFGNNLNAAAGGFWTSCDSNFIHLNNQDIWMQGPSTNNFFFYDHPSGTSDQIIAYDTGAGEPATWNVTGNLYYHNGSNLGGEFLNISASAPTSAVTLNVGYNIGLPNGANGKASGALIASGNNGSNLTINVYHNTVAAEGAEAISYGLSQTVLESPSRWALVKANLCFGTAAQNGLKAFDAQAGNGTQNLLPPSVCDYNAGYQLAAGTGTNAGNGYQGNYSATPGTHDLTLSAGPGFADSTRSLATWSSLQGGAGTDASALSLLQANPALITQATTGLLPWIRAGFTPTNPSLMAASYPGDPSTSDAAGNPWPGGSPGLGAMAVAGGAPSGVLTGGAQGGKKGGIRSGGRNFLSDDWPVEWGLIRRRPRPLDPEAN
jgi:hypothetical protein